MERRRSRPCPTAPAASVSIGCDTPRTRTSSTCAPVIVISTTGRSTMCHISICPVFITLKNAPIPTELKASLPLAEIHWESKFCCDT
jgi:hypothetical protein